MIHTLPLEKKFNKLIFSKSHSHFTLVFRCMTAIRIYYSKYLSSLIIKSLIFNFIFFVSSNAFGASSCEAFLTSKNSFLPYLFNFKQTIDSETSVFDLTNVETSLGPLRLKTSVLKRLRDSISDFSGSLESKAKFIELLLIGEIKPVYVNSSFLDWVIEGYRYILTAESMSHKNVPGLTDRLISTFGGESEKKQETEESSVVDLKSFMLEQMVRGYFIGQQHNRNHLFGVRDFVQDKRNLGLISPLIFRSDRQTWDDLKHEWHTHLTDFEVDWLFRIIHAWINKPKLLLKKLSKITGTDFFLTFINLEMNSA